MYPILGDARIKPQYEVRVGLPKLDWIASNDLEVQKGPSAPKPALVFAIKKEYFQPRFHLNSKAIVLSHVSHPETSNKYQTIYNLARNKFICLPTVLF